ncbi:MAG: hypothetical protein MI922_27965, partial [Bacteroidales bacterium]|nr:hypothetical protein [Bacteroidales bacterium]
MVLLPLSVSFSVLAEDAVLVVLGPAWIEVAPVLTILAFAVYFRLGYKFCTAINYAFGRVYLTTVFQLTYATVVIGGGYFAAISWGLEGVAFVVLGAIVLQYVLHASTVLLVLEESPVTFIRRHVGAVVVALVNFVASTELVAISSASLRPIEVLGVY